MAPGDVVLLAGPNGAGKTTLLRCLAGLLRPTRGEVLLDGTPITSSDAASRRRIGFVAHQTWLHDDLTLLENLAFAARLYSLPSPHDAALAALERAGLVARAGTRPPALSRGMQQRAAIARALLHDPAVRLLDEPFTGLDGDASDRLRDQIAAGASDGRITVIVTHQPDDAWAVATRVAGLHKGRLVLDQPKTGDTASFRASFDTPQHD